MGLEGVEKGWRKCSHGDLIGEIAMVETWRGRKSSACAAIKVRAAPIYQAEIGTEKRRTWA